MIVHQTHSPMMIVGGPTWQTGNSFCMWQAKKRNKSLYANAGILILSEKLNYDACSRNADNLKDSSSLIFQHKL